MTVIINGTSGITNDATDLNYTGTLTGGTGVVNLGSGQLVKDASGNVGIGTSSPTAVARASFGNNAATTPALWAAYFGTNTALASIPPNFGISLGWNYSGGNGENNFVYGTGLGGASGLIFASSSGTAVTERMRIDSSGNLLVGQTVAGGNIAAGGIALRGPVVAGSSSVLISHVTNTGTGNSFAEFSLGGNYIGGIIQNGTTGVSYTSSSDYRLKDTIAPMTGALAKVAALKPCTYKWKVDRSDGQGFIAHELQAVVPDCVTGEKDAVDAEGKPQYQGIDTSFLVATLTGGIQELKAIVDAQAARITALEGTPA